jgi:hypothetical protein
MSFASPHGVKILVHIVLGLMNMTHICSTNTMYSDFKISRY